MAKNLQLQSLKGIAAVIVYCSHSFNQFPTDVTHWFRDTGLNFIYDGQLSVMFFMLLSGYFYFKERPVILNFKNYMWGVKRKVFRIYPVHIVTITLGFILCNNYWGIEPDRYSSWAEKFWNSPVDIIEYIRQCTILFMSDPDLINPPVWYLKVEVEMFLLMPIVFALFNKYKWYVPLLFFVLFGITGRFGYVITYVTGMTLHYLYHTHPDNIKKVFGNFIIIPLGLFLLGIFDIFHIEHNYQYSLLLIQILGGIMVISNLLVNRYKLLESRWLVTLGDISYEIYLVHFVILLWLRRYFDNVLIFIVVTFILTIILSKIINSCLTVIQNKVRKSVCKIITQF